MALREAETAEVLLDDALGEGRALRLARSDNQLALGHAFFDLGREREGREACNPALTVLLQLADGPGGAESQPMLAEAYLVLDFRDEARSELRELWNRGYGDSYLRDLAIERGIVP